MRSKVAGEVSTQCIRVSINGRCVAAATKRRGTQGGCKGGVRENNSCIQKSESATNLEKSYALHELFFERFCAWRDAVYGSGGGSATESEGVG